LCPANVSKSLREFLLMIIINISKWKKPEKSHIEAAI